MVYHDGQFLQVKIIYKIEIMLREIINLRNNMNKLQVEKILKQRYNTTTDNIPK